MTTTIYHNPRCTKSRDTLNILRDNGIEPQIIEYLKAPPSVEDIKHILELLHIAPRALMRSKEQTYSDLALDNADLSDEQLINAMADNPILIERPIVIHNGKAVISRPAETVLEIL